MPVDSLATTRAADTPHGEARENEEDGTQVIINSALGRVKERARGRSQQVALGISDPDNPYRYSQSRGKVVEITEEGAYDMIDHLSDKYRGEPFDHAEGEVRVTYRISPESVQPKG